MSNDAYVDHKSSDSFLPSNEQLISSADMRMDTDTADFFSTCVGDQPQGDFYGSTINPWKNKDVEEPVNGRSSVFSIPEDELHSVAWLWGCEIARKSNHISLDCHHRISPNWNEEKAKCEKSHLCKMSGDRMCKQG